MLDGVRKVLVGLGLCAGISVLACLPEAACADVTYVVEPESFISFDCPCCELLDTGGPVTGSFKLVPVAAEGGLAEHYNVEDLMLVVDGPQRMQHLTGSGTYQRDDGAMPREQMDLELVSSEGFSYGTSTSGLVDPFAVFPTIHLQVSSPFDGCNLYYRFTLIASPRDAPKTFRRGDVNADGKVDLADAVATLGWMFQGQTAPSCLATADANFDGSLDLSDAVSILLYLFAAAPPPAPPGPESCGVSPDPLEPCEAYAACK